VRSALLYFSDAVATVFRIGHLPLAPGTWGSAAAVVGWYLLPELSSTLYWLIVINLFLIGVIASAIISRRDSDDDPSKVIIDEWVGMWLVLPFAGKSWIWILAAFVCFRLFDILKPFPIKAAEKIRGGWGIMLDDVIAGGYSIAVLMLLRIIL